MVLLVIKTSFKFTFYTDNPVSFVANKNSDFVLRGQLDYFQ
jgi:hypothetical protein